MPVATRCPCGAAFKVPDKFAGRQVKCPSCGKAVRVPSPAAKAPGVGGPKTDAGGVSELLDEVELGTSQTGRRCPECRADLAPDDLICVKCGYHTETGKRIKTKRVEKIEKLGGVVVKTTKTRSSEDAPPAVKALAKLLNQAGALFLLVAILFAAYGAYQAMQENPSQGIDALIGWLTSQGLFIIGGGLLLGPLPFAVAANLVQSGNAAGRILSIVMGIAAVPILLGLLIIKLALSDEVSRYCKA